MVTRHIFTQVALGDKARVREYDALMSLLLMWMTAPWLLCTPSFLSLPFPFLVP